MGNKVTIYSIASELGLSPSMVSRAFDPSCRIDSDKRRRILEKADEYGFRPNSFASRMSKENVKIGVFLYRRFGSIGECMLRGIEKAYDALKDYKIVYRVTVISAEEKEPFECRDELLSFSDCDGVIVSGLSDKKCEGMLSELREAVKNVVQLQSVNEEFDCLFSSKHSESLASHISAEFLGNCLARSARRNVLLFTGNMGSAVHSKAKAAFVEACSEFGLSIIGCYDMKDRDDVLAGQLSTLTAAERDAVDGIYITSANSESLCRYVRDHMPSAFLVTFDVFDATAGYIREGVVNATIFQNVSAQAESAFTGLARYLIFGERPERFVFSSVQLVMKSNLELYLGQT